MPAILTLQLVPQILPPSLPYLGEAVRALIYDTMRQARPEFAGRIHSDNDYKPFVASAPIPPRRPLPACDGDAPPPPQTSPWAIRCGCLDEKLTDALLIGLWERYSGGDAIRLGPAQFTFASPPWKVSHVARYEELLRPTPARRWRFRFISPMAVTSHGRPVPLPVPELVFRGLAPKWNLVAPPELHFAEDVIEDMPRRVELTSWRGESRSVRLTSHEEVGFRGAAVFRMTGSEDRMAHAAAALARFAAYAGVGRKTTTGMGQAVVAAT